MDYIGITEAAEKWGLSKRRLQFLCATDKIPGAKSVGKQWVIPTTAERPLDGRTKQGKKNQELVLYRFPFLVATKAYAQRDSLKADERLILDAQIDYLKGDYLASVTKAQEALSHALPLHLKVGAYVAIAYSTMVLALHREFKKAVAEIQKAVDEDTPHTEDYRLLLYAITSVISWKEAPVLSLRPEKMSEESYSYYIIILLLISMVKRSTESVYTILTIESFCIQAHREEMYPVEFLFHCILGSVCRDNQQTDKMKYHIQCACDLAIQYDWVTYQSKFYNAQKACIDEYLSEKNPDALLKMEQKAKRNIANWRQLTKMENSFIPYENVPYEDLSFLILLYNDCTDEFMAKFFHTSIQKIEETVVRLCQHLSLSSREELVAYTKQQHLL